MDTTLLGRDRFVIDLWFALQPWGSRHFPFPFIPFEEREMTVCRKFMLSYSRRTRLLREQRRGEGEGGRGGEGGISSASEAEGQLSAGGRKCENRWDRPAARLEIALCPSPLSILIALFWF